MVTDNDARVCHCLRVNSTRMTFLMHWSFKTGYHEIAAKKFLATGAPFPECKSWKRFHAPGSVEGWILVEADTADAGMEQPSPEVRQEPDVERTADISTNERTAALHRMLRIDA